MKNEIVLTDDELCTLQTALQLSLMSKEKFIEVNGNSSLDGNTVELFDKMQQLFDRFEKEYF